MPVSLFNKVAGLRPASEKETLRRRPFRQIGSQSVTETDNKFCQMNNCGSFPKN